MATTELTSNGTEQHIPIPMGRRIREILLERKITPNSFYKKVGMGRGTFYDCLDGKRRISPSELRKIAEKLNLTVERIKQEDTSADIKELRGYIAKRIASKRAIQLSESILNVAIGSTEKFEALNDLGLSFFLVKQYKEAFDAWQNATLYAEDLVRRFNDQDRLFKVTKNLIVAHTLQKDFSGLYRLLNKFAPAFEQSKAEYVGALRYSQAMVAFEMGNKEECKTMLYESLEYYRLTDNPRDIGTALHNIAYAESQLGNLEKSLELHEEAFGYLSEYPSTKYVSYKDYSKTLLALGRKSDAARFIQKCLEDIPNEQEEYVTIQAKLLLLYAYSSNSIESAEAVLAMNKVDRSLHMVACKFLMDYYCSIGDSGALMKYYKIMGQHTLASSNSWRGL
ncbi:hypothetical protein CBW65_03935 [Tumebacillus avium]|uniref:HTH cro/C1-type domain-containing protein n=1 Tax=Tumebacillus avium TaxID=1903704 RepID=A0A1Y0IIM3_9BACL|nr:helix-turn-helix transcriptional regulator [Tumebacillus avium]ARU60307.1 hypothetical protein CBW65_03935 [Tumebacillus avium]